MTPLETIGAIIAVVGGVIAIITALFRPLYIAIKRTMDRLDKFFRDWDGEEAEPGRDGVPGVMARLNAIDGELKRNGGSTMKDAIHRIEEKVNNIDERLTLIEKREDKYV